MKKVFIRTILLLFFATLSATTVYPCSCEFWSPLKKLRKAEAVFVGEVVEIGSNEKNKDFPVTIKLKVERRWKGAKESSVAVVTTNDYCFGMHTSEGRKYLIFAYETKEGQLETNLCVSEPFERANEDLKAIGKGKKPKTKA